MPPCQRVLCQKIKRTNLVASRWCAATEPLEPSMSPAEYGWVCEDDKYKIKWFHGEAAPRSLDIILDEADVEEDEEIEVEEDMITEEESSDEDSSDDDLV